MFVFHVLCLDFVVSVAVLDAVVVVNVGVCFRYYSVVYKQPYEGALNKYFQKINFLELFFGFSDYRNI